MPPVRNRAVPKRFADAPVSARGRPAKRGRNGPTATKAVVERSPDTPQSTADPSDQPMAAGFQAAMMAQLQAMQQTMQQTNLQLLARLEAVEKAQTETSATGGSSATRTQLELTSQQPQAVVNRVVDSVIESVTGEARITNVPVDLHVTDKVKHAIWQGQFVEFADLLQQDADPEYTLSVDTSGQPSLTLAQKSRQKKLSFTKWGEAWNLFQFVLARNPTHTCTQAGFAKHYEVVSGLFHKGQDWDFYDRSFRVMIEKGLAKWGEKNFDLAFEAKQRFGQQVPKQSKGGPARHAGVPRGFCNYFHKMGTCTFGDKCNFSHSCVNCAGSHSAKSCPDSQSFRGNKQQPSTKNRLASTAGPKKQ